MNLNDLAQLIFPEVNLTINDLEEKFKERDLPSGAEVTRFAPSPTGFLHTGSLFTSFVAMKIAKQSNGVFYTRLEDTDGKREIKGSGEELLTQLEKFNIIPDEGYTLNGEVGEYGPYIQSKRKYIYDVVIKELIKKGLAYPCFCGKEDLDNIRKYQEEHKITPGYYKEYAKCRNLTVDEAYKLISEGKPYVIRFKSYGDSNNKIKVHDEIRGNLELSENDQDIVIMKSDGLPTYHMAHVIDDHFMRTTLVSRGEEWLSSLPIHLQLFDALNFKRVKYAHLPVIMKVDENGNRRKLSKRKDNEAAVSYFLKDGYPVKPILTYLMSIANSNFEEYLIANKDGDYNTFKFSLSKMSLDGALFDLEKLKYFSKEYLASLNKDEMTKLCLGFAREFDSNLLELINRDESYFKDIINIEREKDKPRKDYSHLSEIYNGITYFYSDLYEKSLSFANDFTYLEKIKKEELRSYLLDLKDNLKFLNISEQEWFASLKDIASRHNFCTNNKEYKQNPTIFNGNVADASQILRYVITLRYQTPNLYNILCIIKEDEFKNRIDKFINKFLN